MDIVSYILARKYTDQTVDGLGAVKGAPCTVDSVVDITGGKRITLGWESDSGVKQTQSFDIMDGVDGVSVESIAIDAYSHLIVTYSDGTSSDAGLIDIPVQSVNGKTGAVNLTASDVGALPSDTPIPSKTSDLDNDSGFVTQSTLDNYVEKEENKSLMSSAEHTKLQGIEANAQRNVQPDFNQTDDTADDYIKNKPPTITVDSELSDSSTNPVQNKVVKAAIDTKADASALDDYVQKITGKGLSTEDYTTNEKLKLANIADNAERNTIVSISVNGVPVVPSSNRNVNIEPTGDAAPLTNEQLNSLLDILA